MRSAPSRRGASSLDRCRCSRTREASARRVLLFVAVLVCIQTTARAEPDGDPDESAALEHTPSECSMNSPIGPLAYRSGRGVSIGETGLNIGGFSTVELDRNEGDPLSVQLDSLNLLLLYEPVDAFRIFGEFEIGHLLAYEVHGDVRSDPTFQIERLYGELSLDDPVNLRFGKFQTPVGRWNLVPAEPFVWTATDPVLIDMAFDEHQTGIALTGSVFPYAGRLEYWIYSQMIDPIDEGDSPPPENRSVGGRMQFTKSLQGWSVGTSFLATERKREWSYLGGLDAEIRYGDLELLSELAIEDGDIPSRKLFGAFIQGRFDLVDGFSFVARYEYFDRIGSGRPAAHIGDVGFAWFAQPWLILKATYRFSSRETDDVQRGLSSSISVVF